jgi:membrane protein YqaA with SNARE-associated domain
MMTLAALYFYCCSAFSGAVMGWEIGRIVDKVLARRRYRRMSTIAKFNYHLDKIGNAILVHYGNAGLVATMLVLVCAIIGMVAMVQ